MIFTSSFLTTAGIQLLTQAASGSSIVWTDCGCSSVYDQDTITASTTTFDSFVCKGTAVATFNNSGNVAAISCSMTNNNQDCTEGDADVFGLWAHVVDPLGDIGEDVLVLIAKRGSAAATHFPEYIDETTELTAIVDLSVEMNDGVVASINLIQSAFALAHDLQTEITTREALSARVEDLYPRAVTTHVSGAPTTGEAQTIYGAKKFADSISTSYLNPITDGGETYSSNNVILQCGNTKNSNSGNFTIDANYRYQFEDGEYTYPTASEITLKSVLRAWDGSPEEDLYIRFTNYMPNHSSIIIGSQNNSANATCTINMNTYIGSNLGVSGDLSIDGECSSGIFTAILPNADNGGGSANFKVGALALVYISSSETIYDANAGTVIGRNNIVNMTMYYAIGGYGYFSQGNQINIDNSMRFRLLNQLDKAGGIALVMRIE